MTPRYTSQILTMKKCASTREGGRRRPLPEERAQRRLVRSVDLGECQSVRDRELDALLLLEGTNDLNDGTISLSKIREALRADIRHALDAGVQQVFLSTLPPEFGFGGDMVPAMNDEIRSLAVSEQHVVLIDSYTVLGGQSSTLIGIDGIHPTAAGQQLMADASSAAVQANFEVLPATGALARTRR